MENVLERMCEEVKSPLCLINNEGDWLLYNRKEANNVT